MYDGQTITDIKARRRSKNRVNLFVNDKFACVVGLNTLQESGIQIGQSISDTELEHLKRADLIQRAMERALRFLAQGPKSEFELRSRLKRYGYDADVVTRTITRMRESGYLDDEAFAKQWKESRVNHSARSASQIARELKRKGIHGDIIAATVVDVDDETEAYRAGYEKAVGLKNADMQEFRRKLGTFLRSRGFEHDVIDPILERLWVAKDNEDQK